MPSFRELERAAGEVLHILKCIKELEDASVAVIGGLALWKYIPSGRTTEDVDFIVNVRGAPESVKRKLLELPESPFTQYAQFFYYKNPAGVLIQIDIVPFLQSPYLPSNAVKLKNLATGTIPYISINDLIVFKIHSCGLRAQPAKRRTDANDAEALLSTAAARVPITLSASQKAELEPCIDDVVRNGGQDEEWWRQRLGLPARK